MAHTFSHRAVNSGNLLHRAVVYAPLIDLFNRRLDTEATRKEITCAVGLLSLLHESEPVQFNPWRTLKKTSQKNAT